MRVWREVLPTYKADCEMPAPRIERDAEPSNSILQGKIQIHCGNKDGNQMGYDVFQRTLRISSLGTMTWKAPGRPGWHPQAVGPAP